LAVGHPKVKLSTGQLFNFIFRPCIKTRQLVSQVGIPLVGV